MVYFCYCFVLSSMIYVASSRRSETNATTDWRSWSANRIFSKKIENSQFLYNTFTPNIFKRFRRDQDNASLTRNISNDFIDKEYDLYNISDLVLRKLSREMFAICPFADICGNMVGFHFDRPTFCCIVCYCETSCIYANSCCPHYLETARSKIDIQPSEPYQLPALVCQPAAYLYEKLLTSVLRSTGHHYSFIASCPDLSTESQIDLCRSDPRKGFRLEDVTPLFDASTIHNYMNRHCAKCNNIDMRHVIPWKPKLRCGDIPLEATELSEMEEEVYRRNDCFVQFLPPDDRTMATICDTDRITTCNETGLWSVKDDFLEYACSVYRLMYTFSERRYNNIFCALCNGEILHPDNYVTCDNQNIVRMFSLLMSLKLPEIEGDVRSDPCQADRVFDPLTGQCRLVYCTPPYILNIRGKTCSDIAGNNFISALEISARATFNQVLPAKIALDQVLNYMNNKLNQNRLCGIKLYPKTTQQRNINSVFKPDTYTTEVMFVIYTNTETYGDTSEHYKTIVQQLHQLNTFEIGPFRKNVSMEITMHGIDPLLQIPSLETQFINALFPSNAINWTQLAVSKMVQFYEDPYDNTLVASGIEITNTVCARWDLVYDLEFLPCMTFTYNIDNVNFKRTPSGLMFDDRILFRFGEFISINDSYVLICIDAVQQKLSGSSCYYLAHGVVTLSLMLNTLVTLG